MSVLIHLIFRNRFYLSSSRFFCARFVNCTSLPFSCCVLLCILSTVKHFVTAVLKSCANKMFLLLYKHTHTHTHTALLSLVSMATRGEGAGNLRTGMFANEGSLDHVSAKTLSPCVRGRAERSVIITNCVAYLKDALQWSTRRQKEKTKMIDISIYICGGTRDDLPSYFYISCRQRQVCGGTRADLLSYLYITDNATLG